MQGSKLAPQCFNLFFLSGFFRYDCEEDEVFEFSVGTPPNGLEEKH